MDNTFGFERTSQSPPTETVAWEIVFSVPFFKTHAQRLRRCRRRWNAQTVINTLLLAIMVGLNVLVYTSPSHEPSTQVVMLILLVLLIIVQWSRPFLVSRRWRKSPLLDKRTRLELSPVDVHVVDDLSEGRTQWAAFTRARRFADGWLLFFGADLAYWLPDACLVVGTAEEASRIIRIHVPDCQNL